MDSTTIHIITYGIATEIIGVKKKTISLPSPLTIGRAKEYLVKSYPRFEDLASLSFAVSEEYRADEFELNDNDELIIIPPVSGG